MSLAEIINSHISWYTRGMDNFIIDMVIVYYDVSYIYIAHKYDQY